MIKEELKRRIGLYSYEIDKRLTENLINEIRSPLANILAMHYYDIPENNSSNTAVQSASRVKVFLIDKVILDYNFSTVLSLFTVAIAQQEVYSENIADILGKNNNKEHITSITSAILSDEYGENFEVKQFVDYLMNKSDPYKVIDYIVSNQSKVKEIIKNNLLNTQDKNQENQYDKLYNEIKSASDKQYGLSYLTQNISLIFSLAVGVGASLACASTFGILAPLAIIPVTFTSLNHSAKIAEKVSGYLLPKAKNIGEIIENSAESFVKETKKIMEKLGITQSKEQELTAEQNKQKYENILLNTNIKIEKKEINLSDDQQYKGKAEVQLNINSKEKFSDRSF